MSILSPFYPRPGAGITESATTTTTPYLIDTMTTTPGGGAKQVCVSNQGNTNGVYVAFGGSGVTVTDAGYYVFPGSQVVLTKSMGDGYIAIMSAASTTAVHVVVGEGF